MVTSEVNEVDNKEVVDEIVAMKLNPDLPNGYRMLTRNLQMVGYYILMGFLKGLRLGPVIYQLIM